MSSASKAGGSAMPAPNEFRVLTEVSGKHGRIVSVVGDLDISNVDTFRSALIEATQNERIRLVVDLSLVSFVDSVGIGAVLHARKRIGDSGRMAVAVPDGSYAAVIFDVVGADALVDVFNSRAAAVAHVS
jgi:anti-sigma B factor antagonist